MLLWKGPRRLLLVPPLAVFAVLAFAACSDDDDEGDLSATETPAATETPLDTPTEAPDDGDGGGDAADFNVEQRGFAFAPGDFTVSAGETVTFNITNSDGVIHNMHIAPNVLTPDGPLVVEFGEAFCDGAGEPCSDPAAISGGETAVLEWTVPDVKGFVQFQCDFHPITMSGMIIIE